MRACVLRVGSSPHRSLHTEDGEPGREAPVIGSQRTVVFVSRLEPPEEGTTAASRSPYALHRAWCIIDAQKIFVQRTARPVFSDPAKDYLVSVAISTPAQRPSPSLDPGAGCRAQGEWEELLVDNSLLSVCSPP